MNRNLSSRFYLSYFLKGWKRIFYAGGPLFVTVFITSRCNARCAHCFYWNRINKPQEELSPEEIDKISKSMPAFPKLLISGGEPYLRQDIDEICRIFFLNNRISQITIPTNGILTETICKKTANILESCKTAKIQVQLSVDGIGKNHDAIRGKEQAFEKMMGTYYSLSGLGKQYANLEINFCLTLSKLNHNRIREVYDYLSAKGIKNFSVLMARRPVMDESLLDFGLNSYNKWIEFVEKKYAENKSFSHRFFSVRNVCQMKIIKRVIEERDFKFRCLAGRLTAVIDENGLVYPCENEKTAFGCLRKENYDFNSIWNNDKAREFRKSLSFRKCRCTHESNIMTNISFDMRLLPRFVIKSIR